MPRFSIFLFFLSFIDSLEVCTSVPF